MNTNSSFAVPLSSEAAAPVTPPAPSSAEAKASANRQAILTGPILPTILRLALPTSAVLVAQIAAVMAETWYVGLLGTDALAGVAVVFPVWMLMVMMSNGGIGSGVSSAVARATGAGRRDEVAAITFHAVLIAVVMGLVFTTGSWIGGPILYRSLGSVGPSLAAALSYSNWLFVGAVPIWIVNLLAAALRGSGNVRLPALVTFVGTAILVPISPLLIFGWGPVPWLGIAGAGIAMGVYYTGAAVVLARHLAGGRAGLTLRAMRPQWRYFREILRIGIPVALIAAQVNATVILVTAVAGHFGVKTLAGYGIASRLDYMMIPLAFGLATAVLAMVGINVGAGQHRRARQIAWAGGFAGAALIGSVGLVTALFPGLWINLYTSDPAVLEPARFYLQTVAPFYAALGLGFVLGFAAQGAGLMTWPLAANFTRLFIAGGAGWFVVVKLGAPLGILWMMIDVSLIAYALLSAIAFMGWVKGQDVGPAAAGK